MWRLNKMLQNNQWVTEEIKGEIKKNTLSQIKVEKQHSKIHGMWQKQF